MLFSKILVPVDFSRRSLGMVHYACKLGARYKAKVTLLNVIETPCYGVPGAGLELPAFAPVLPEWKAQHEARLDEFARSACPDVAVEAVVVEGNPAGKIVESACTMGADLLTMPTHGYGVFRRLLIGSVTSKVLHDVACPVFTGVHVEATPAAGRIHFDRVLCAVDLKRDCQRVLQWAASFATDFAARLIVLHVVPMPFVPTDSAFDANWFSELEQMATTQLSDLCSELGVTAEVRTATGSPITCTASTAREEHADVVVIGRSTDEHLGGRLRANAYGIIRQSPCPVISV
jgi:nucleotide-binding universal stress UspA family protein